MNSTSKRVDFKKWLFPTMPDVASMEEWDEWNSTAEQSKFKWFIADTVPTWFAVTFQYRYENAISKLKSKYIRKHNLIKVNTLKDDEWYDTDTRMMHGMFQLLIDFVELEKAHMEIAFNITDAPRYMRKVNYRSAEMGLKYLDWEISLSKEEGGLNQSKNAKIIKELFVWWKYGRPSRIEPMDARGSMGMSTNEFYSDMDDDKNENDRISSMFAQIDRRKDKEPELYESVNKACEAAEEKYEKEDEQMLIKLVKIRKSLWT
jgi:hypothetical protein